MHIHHIISVSWSKVDSTHCTTIHHRILQRAVFCFRILMYRFLSPSDPKMHFHRRALRLPNFCFICVVHCYCSQQRNLQSNLFTCNATCVIRPHFFLILTPVIIVKYYHHSIVYRMGIRYKFMCVSVPTSHHSHEGSTVSSPYIPPPPPDH